jgi:hypothetical protein
MKISHTVTPINRATSFNDWAQHIHNEKTKTMKGEIKKSKKQYRDIVISSVMGQTSLPKDKATQMVYEFPKIFETGFYTEQTAHLTAVKIVANALNQQ